MVGKRKFVSEFSVSITSKGWLMFTPDQLHADGKMNDELQEVADNSHIYLICKKPKATCCNEQPIIHNGLVSGKVSSRVKGKEIVSEYTFPFEFEDNEVSLNVANYPHKKNSDAQV
ncbi:hypothetical protein ACR0RW_16540 [Klebsiella pneumoniae]|uniref:hypothetical protein n=1 Tax=Klebsiella pneumoniae TaxID=573 RepID=UPI003D96E06F